MNGCGTQFTSLARANGATATDRLWRAWVRASIPPVLSVLCALGTTPAARAIVSSNAGNSVFNGVNINQFVGAEAFYWQDYWGWRAVIANVEAGGVWNGHETLTQVSTYFNDPSIDVYDPLTGALIRQYDWHATLVGHVLNGQGWGYGWIIDDFNLATWFGIAPGATLWSGAIATAWIPNPPWDYSGSFNISTQSLVYAYQTAMHTGLGTPPRRADVVNSSWGFDDPAGNAQETMIIDALAYANHTTVVLAAGNHDLGWAPVTGPASGYNSIAVAALAPDTSHPPYNAAAPFSNTGPNDYYNPLTGTTTAGVRYRVDIAAPGDNLTLAYYGGLTGGHTGGSDPSDGAGNYYAIDLGGTSLASPIVAGGAALLADVAYDRFGGGSAIDGRVIKAVLLNSADKTPGWNNGQALDQGVITTSQGLDVAVGTGRINLAQAFTQYTAGTTDVPGLGGGSVKATGWDYGQIADGTPNDYLINQLLHTGESLTATLCWFANRGFDENTQTAYDVQLSDLDLQVWRINNGLLTDLVAQSISAENNVEHLYFPVPADGSYMIRVLWAGENYDIPGNTPDSEAYALAWSVPEPDSLMLLLLAVGMLSGWRLVRNLPRIIHRLGKTGVGVPRLRRSRVRWNFQHGLSLLQSVARSGDRRPF